MPTSRGTLWTFVPVVAVVALLAVSCGGDGGGASEAEAADLRAQLADMSRDAQYWQQLTGLIEPVELASMTDHRAYMLPNGHLLALHFDNMDLERAENLNWVALGVPGTFCENDQQRVEEAFGDGFTHFHDLEADTHSGDAGAEGVWFVHVGVRDLRVAHVGRAGERRPDRLRVHADAGAELRVGRSMPRRKIEVLTFAGCPNEDAARALVARVVADLELEADVVSVRVGDPDAADGLRFLGSPTIRIDGEDVEPGAGGRADYTLACRVYRTAGGLVNLPDETWVRAALRAGEAKGEQEPR